MGGAALNKHKGRANRSLQALSWLNSRSLKSTEGFNSSCQICHSDNDSFKLHHGVQEPDSAAKLVARLAADCIGPISICAALLPCHQSA